MYEQFRNRMDRQGHYMGETMRKQSEAVVDALWMNSVSTRPVQVKVINSGLPPTYESVDDFEEVLWAHFDANQKFNVTKDEVDYYLTFRPGEMKRHPEIKVGSYVCIPNVDDELEWWLLMHIDDDNELRKCQILKTNYILKWVTGGKIYNTSVCLRQANSYNSGSWSGDSFDFVDNIFSVFAPTNHDTLTIKYDQRMIISDKDRRPSLVWKISKIEDTTPQGITKFRFTQETLDAQKDNEELGLADYYASSIEPIPNDPIPNMGTAAITYSGTTPTIKVGGSFKIFTAVFSNDDVTVDKWTISDENGDISGDTGNYTIEDDDTKLRLKIAQNYNLIGKVLIVKVIGSDDSTAEVQMEVV